MTVKPSTPSTPRPTGAHDHLLKLIALEQQVRRCATVEELLFAMVNQTHGLIPYYRAAAFRLNSQGRPVTAAVSGVSTLDRNTPFAQGLNELALLLIGLHPGPELKTITPAEVHPAAAERWRQWMPDQALLCPLAGRDGKSNGLLLFCREQPFDNRELALFDILRETYSHAWSAFLPKRRKSLLPTGRKRRLLIGAVAVATLLLAFMPVPESVLAPGEIVPLDPVAVTSPVKGMIRDIDVQPYQTVTRGQLLFHLEDTELVSQLALAEKGLQVAQADYLRAEQKAFSDPVSKADLELYRVKAEEKELVVRYTREELERQKVTALDGGMVLFNDRNDWIGKPVAAGEKVMTLADPTRAEIEIRMAVDDAISLEPGAKVRFFLHTDPLNPIVAELSRTSYKAEVQPDRSMAFALRARFTEPGQQPRIGLQGTAKVFGGSVPLAYYVFRKPLAVIRRTLGL